MYITYDKLFEPENNFFHIFGVLLVLPIYTYFPSTESFDFLRYLFVLFCRSFQPIYFGLAGYLFFINISGRVKSKLLNRVRTLLIPYLLWNVFFALFIILLLYIGIDSPIVSNFKNGAEQNSFIQQLIFIFWKPVAGHLWFIRDLMLVSLLSGPLFILLRNKRWITLVALGIIALVTTQCQTASLFSFAVGGYLSINEVNIQKIKRCTVIIAGIVFIGMLILFTYIRVEHNAIPLMSGVQPSCYGVFMIRLFLSIHPLISAHGAVFSSSFICFMNRGYI